MINIDALIQDTMQSFHQAGMAALEVIALFALAWLAYMIIKIWFD